MAEMTLKIVSCVASCMIFDDTEFVSRSRVE